MMAHAVWPAEPALQPLLTEIRGHADWAGIIDVRLAVRARSGPCGVTVAPIPADEPRQGAPPAWAHGLQSSRGASLQRPHPVGHVQTFS